VSYPRSPSRAATIIGKSYRDDKTDDDQLSGDPVLRIRISDELDRVLLPSAELFRAGNRQRPAKSHPCEESSAIGSAGATRRDEISLRAALVDRDRRPFGLSSRSELERACWTIGWISSDDAREWHLERCSMRVEVTDLSGEFRRGRSSGACVPCFVFLGGLPRLAPIAARIPSDRRPIPKDFSLGRDRVCE